MQIVIGFCCVPKDACAPLPWVRREVELGKISRTLGKREGSHSTCHANVGIGSTRDIMGLCLLNINAERNAESEGTYARDGRGLITRKEGSPRGEPPV